MTLVPLHAVYHDGWRVLCRDAGALGGEQRLLDRAGIDLADGTMSAGHAEQARAMLRKALDGPQRGSVGGAR